MQRPASVLRKYLASMRAYRREKQRKPFKDMPTFVHLLIVAWATLSLQHIGPKALIAMEEFERNIQIYP